jgi:hypothetical protein
LLLQAYTFCPSDHSWRISNIQRKVWSTLGWLAKKYLHLSRDNIWN